MANNVPGPDLPLRRTVLVMGGIPTPGWRASVARVRKSRQADDNQP